MLKNNSGSSLPSLPVQSSGATASVQLSSETDVLLPPRVVAPSPSIIKFDTRFLKEVRLSLSGTHAVAYLVDEAPALTDIIEYSDFEGDFSWLSNSMRTFGDVLMAMVGKKRIAGKIGENRIFAEFYSLYKGGKLSIEFALPQDICGDTPKFPVSFFFSNVMNLDFDSFVLYPDLNGYIGCKGSFEVEADDYGKHVVGFMANPNLINDSLYTFSNSSFKISASTPAPAIPFNPLKTCTKGSECDLRFSSLGVKSRFTHLMVVDNNPPRSVESLDVVKYNVVGKWYIYGPLRVLSWVVTVGLLMFSFSTCCCGISPVDAYLSARKRLETRDNRGVRGSYQAVASEP
ncbi:hypothetical protein HDU67_002479 [Dinochytrium kinnereticum]|nr:hypothetical protein HDU67_002479 [Dinochytrium kinnereticum]